MPWAPPQQSSKHWWDPERISVTIAREEIFRVKGRVVNALRFELLSYNQS
jgi:hypothetical protein